MRPSQIAECRVSRMATIQVNINARRTICDCRVKPFGVHRSQSGLRFAIDSRNICILTSLMAFGHMAPCRLNSTEFIIECGHIKISKISFLPSRPTNSLDHLMNRYFAFHNDRYSSNGVALLCVHNYNNENRMKMSQGRTPRSNQLGFVYFSELRNRMARNQF